jgi:dTDP-4-amino-4,6-dideoxygalactose transaminase
LLEQKYDGEAHLFYKGREAIQAALLSAQLPAGTEVLITGYTCYAVYKAVVDAGHVPVFVDIAHNQLNITPKTVAAALKDHPAAKVLVLQNTLGYPSDLLGLQKLAVKHKLIVIEDLAHCIGMNYEDGTEAGTIGDFTALSFSQDKVVDGISGGALVVRNKAYKNKLTDTLRYTKLPHKQQLRDRIYPLLTVKIRAAYTIKIGKIFHAACKKLHLLAKPVDGVFGVYRSLPSWYCSLIVDQFAQLNKLAQHRLKIAAIYQAGFSKKIRFNSPHGTPIFLRFPLRIDDRDALFAHLKHSNIYITDVWYETPIAPARYLAKTPYKKGDCAESDTVASTMVNLPTHQAISEDDAHRIVERIQAWLLQH